MQVSWWDAIAYCNRLSEKEKIPVAYRLLGEPNFVPNIIWEVKE
jgi:formylglycine-generating enzyme required for sulfatase activity